MAYLTRHASTRHIQLRGFGPMPALLPHFPGDVIYALARAAKTWSEES